MSKLARPDVIAAIELGLTQTQMAQKFGCAAPTINQFIRKNALVDFFWSKRPDHLKPAGERELAMKAKYEAGYTLESIGAEYGVTRERVRQLLSRHFEFTRENGGQHKNHVIAQCNRDARRNARYIKKYGHDFSTHQQFLLEGIMLRKAGVGYYRTPHGAYINQRRNAQQRGIEWQFKFAEWWAFWQESGKWDDRGRHGDAYVMSRIGDEGPYSRENCVIKTLRENSAEGQVTKKRRHAENLAVAA